MDTKHDKVVVHVMEEKTKLLLVNSSFHSYIFFYFGNEPSSYIGLL